MASIRKAKKEFKKNPYYAKRRLYKVIWYRFVQDGYVFVNVCTTEKPKQKHLAFVDHIIFKDSERNRKQFIV